MEKIRFFKGNFNELPKQLLADAFYYVVDKKQIMINDMVISEGNGGGGEGGDPAKYNELLEMINKNAADIVDLSSIKLDSDKLKTINGESLIITSDTESTDIKIIGVGEVTKEGGEIFNYYEKVTVPINKASQYSHAEGLGTTASGECSHTEGNRTKANGKSSHAEGNITIAKGNYSHVEGYYTSASGECSHSEGFLNNRFNEAISEINNSKPYTFKISDGYNGYRISDILLIEGVEYTIKDIEDITPGPVSILDEPIEPMYSKADLIITVDKEIMFTDGNKSLIILTRGALNNFSHSEGNDTTTYAHSSHAEGKGTITIGAASHAEGLETISSGKASHAEGSGSTSNGEYSHAEGYRTTASGDSSHAEGSFSDADGDSSHAEGDSTKALGDYSHAEGVSTKASGYVSHAEGDRTTALGDYSHTEGVSRKYASEFITSSTMTNDEIISEWVHTKDSFFEQYKNKAFSLAKGEGSHVEGLDCLALGNYSHAECSETKSVGDFSHAEGSGTTASGKCSHTEGYRTTANGENSHSEGYYSSSNGEASHAEGSSTSNGYKSHAEGRGTYSNGDASHAEGSGVKADGPASHAEGGDTMASGDCSHAEGKDTVANNEGEHAEGICNKSHTGETSDKQTLSSIGFGNYVYGNKKNINAFEVMRNGDIYAYGVNGYDGMNVNGNTLQASIANLLSTIEAMQQEIKDLKLEIQNLKKP